MQKTEAFMVGDSERRNVIGRGRAAEMESSVQHNEDSSRSRSRSTEQWSSRREQNEQSGERSERGRRRTHEGEAASVCDILSFSFWGKS